MTALEGETKAGFLRFLRRMLEWDADKQPSARELLKDPWLTLTTGDVESEEEEQDTQEGQGEGEAVEGGGG